MHRHCLRSTLSRCSGTSLPPLINARQLATTASVVPKAGPSTPAEPSKYDKHRGGAKKYKKKSSPKATSAKATHTKDKSVLGPSSNPKETAQAKPQPPLFDYSNLALSELLGSGDAGDADFGMEEFGGMNGFSPGTFVEIRKNNAVMQGIVLGEEIFNQKWMVYTLTERGMILGHYRADVFFSIPNLISADLAAQCGSVNIPTPAMNIARVEALKTLRALTSKVDRQAAGLQMRPMNIYVEVMAEDPTKWSTTTVKHVTELLYDRPLFMDYYMTHKYLMDNSLRYVAMPGYLKTQQFAVRPRRDIEEILAVREYIREYYEDGIQDSVYKTFVDKAKIAVKAFQNDKGRASGPLSQKPFPIRWNETEQVFIRFLLRSMQTTQSSQRDPYAVTRTSIVKDILQPKVDINDTVTLELLTKLGVTPKWFDPFEISVAVNPYGDFTNTKTFENEQKEIMLLSSQSKTKAGLVLGPLDLIPEDPLHSVRHDFGDMKAFVIDDPSAKELDDAVSLERIPSEPGNYWVHIHIADPTSVLHPNHALSKLARERYSTWYLAHKTYPLWSDTLVHNGGESLSLNQLDEKREAKAMTFSIKLDNDGDILDYKVRASIVRNIRQTTYQDVDDALGSLPLDKTFPFGGSEDIFRGKPLSAEEVADLKILQQLADKQAQRVIDSGVLMFSNPSASVTYKTKVPENLEVPSLRGSIFTGYPEAVYSVVDKCEIVHGSRQLVAEMAKLANRTSSRFLQDHGVPMLRRGMEPPIISEESREILAAIRSPRGSVPRQEIIKHFQLNPISQFTLETAAHYALGIPKGEGYVRATSPLRRFEDTIAHWQIQHILKGPNAPRKPPFVQDDLERLSTEMEAKEKLYKQVRKGQERYHALLYMKRLLESRELSTIRPLHRTLAWTQDLVKRNIFYNTPTVRVLLPELGVLAQLEDMPPGKRDMPLGTPLFVTLKSIDIGIRTTRMVVNLHPDSL
ncbi:hypothetical protein D9613_007937 [Agrocybe pediades]|uniref:RNB domain-containing protein n=1 Tax=Agrocybe pediades TaxID=84607 RepID=A0A8H4VL47_9AGAR|nr:hypothetical protein D9613_007937 [Agrocybe pediades]